MKAELRSVHRPVMLREVLMLLEPKPGDIIFDGTIGAGGHAKAFLKRILPGGLLIGTDRDREILPLAKSTLQPYLQNTRLFAANFVDFKEILARCSLPAISCAILDLGPSSFQLDSAERGFSFMRDGPLDMRMDRDSPRMASQLVNTLAESELAKTIRGYSDERYARRLARAICRRRRKTPFRSTLELARLAGEVIGKHRGRIHPATRLFQALRIAVNDELGSLERFLKQAPALLSPGGRLAIISFHSLEDRLVKGAFRRGKQEGYYEVLTPKPLRPSPEEVRENRRARSARLRAVRKIE